jgi:dihydropteroate synthase
VEAAEEMRRVLPVVEALAKQTEAVISIDTTKAAVAAAAVGAGAMVINDVTALRGDPLMPAVAARSDAAVVLMHMLGTTKTMQRDPRYGDVIVEVKAFLAGAAAAAIAAGIKRESIVVDPGIGFGKTIAHNIALIRHLGELCELGYPVLLGASRKSFIGTLSGREPLERLWGTMGAHVAGALMGAHIVRVHDVAPLKEALAVSDAIARA